MNITLILTSSEPFQTSFLGEVLVRSVQYCDVNEGEK